MSFSDDIKRADDQPNAFKLALRMATALSRSPRESKDGWKFAIDKPSDVRDIDLARVLVQAALQQVPKYQRAEVSTFRGELYVAFPRYSDHASTPEFPLQQITSNLRKIQTSLSSNWQRDTDGNLRHAATFVKYGIDAEWLLSALGINLTANVMSNGPLLYTHSIDDKCDNILAMPKEPAQSQYGRARGLCLTPDQVGQLAEHVGFDPITL